MFWRGNFKFRCLSFLAGNPGKLYTQAERGIFKHTIGAHIYMNYDDIRSINNAVYGAKKTTLNRLKRNAML